jgi:hypothetical protein
MDLLTAPGLSVAEPPDDHENSPMVSIINKTLLAFGVSRPASSQGIRFGVVAAAWYAPAFCSPLAGVF